MKLKEKYNVEEVESVGFYETSVYSCSCLGIIERSLTGGRIKFYQSKEPYNKIERGISGIYAGNCIPNADKLLDGINVNFDDKMKINIKEENISEEEFKTFINVLFNYQSDFIDKGHYDSSEFAGIDWRFNIKFSDGTSAKVTGFHEEPEELLNIRKLFNIYGCKFNIEDE